MEYAALGCVDDLSSVRLSETLQEEIAIGEHLPVRRYIVAVNVLADDNVLLLAGKLFDGHFAMIFVLEVRTFHVRSAPAERQVLPDEDYRVASESENNVVRDRCDATPHID